MLRNQASSPQDTERVCILMELNQIKQFRVIARTESISKAAEILFIAQPSLSQTLKRLETELGTPLFDRRGRRIALNGAGKIFLKYCDEIVAALDSASREIGEYIGSEKKEVNILVESTSLLIPEIAQKMRKYHPQSLPHFLQGHSDDWDIKICYDICPDFGSPSKAVMEEPLGIVMHREHYLSSQSRITKKDIEGCEFLSLGKTDGLTAVISHFCAKADFKQNIVMFAETPSVMQEMLKRNFGIAFAPQYTWNCYYDGELIYRPVEDMPMRHFVHLVLNDKKYITKEIQSCYEILVRYYTEYGRQFF